MSNPFDKIISLELKKLFNNAIDGLLSENSLSISCKIKYSGQQNSTYCNNCIFDPISLLSSNFYNSTGPNPFGEGLICPVCLGMGLLRNDFSENINLAFIFDSKFWMNKSANILNIPNGMAQSICGIDLLSKIRNCSEIVLDSSLADYGNYVYERAGDPEPVGLGDNRYIITMWKRK